MNKTQIFQLNITKIMPTRPKQKHRDIGVNTNFTVPPLDNI